MARGARSGCGLNINETVVMDLWDAGRSIEQIADSTGIKRLTVGNIVSLFDVNGPEDREREIAIRGGCARYATALALAGKVYA